MLDRVLLVGACVVVLAMTAAAQPPGMQSDRGNRGDLLEQLAAAEVAWRSEPGAESIMEYATRLFEAGRFERSRELLASLLTGADRPLDAVHLAARVDYYTGNYASAERLFTEAIAGDPTNARAAMGLLMTHYQTNAYERGAELPDEMFGGRPIAHLDIMRAMEGMEPYEVCWSDGRTTEVPFLDIDPLPVVEVTINGRSIFVIIDTGADMFILDTEIAAEMGMETVATMQAMFAGGMRGELGFGVAESLTLGGVTLHNVPISMLPTAPLSLTDRTIGGIIGVGVLKQFLSTMDYPGNRLVLRERSEAAVEALRVSATERVVEDTPFYLSSTHFLLVHGSLNGYNDLIFHVDSGLGGAPSFATTQEALEYVGIPIPETEVRDHVTGGGGGGFAVGEFEIAELGLGSLVGHDLVGSYGGQPPGSYWMAGFIIDGLISHNFLRDYAWTLDFDGMRMIFSQ